MRNLKRDWLFAAFTGICLAAPTGTHAGLRYSLADVGVLNGFDTSAATGLSSFGLVVGYCGLPDHTNSHAFVFNPFIDGPVNIFDLGLLPKGSYAAADAMDSTSQIVGYGNRDSRGEPRAILWRDGNIIDLISGSPATNAYATGLNDAGLITGYMTTNVPDELRAVLWRENPQKPGTFDATILNPPPGAGPAISHSVAFDINTTGVVAGASSLNPDGGHASLWLPGIPNFPVILPELTNGGTSAAFAVNDKGEVAGLATAGENRPVIWDNDNTHTIHNLGLLRPEHYEGIANDINNFREVVGESGTGNTGRAFIHAGGQMYDLNDLLDGFAPGWILNSATGINDLGMISGIGTYQGKQRGFLLFPSSSQWGLDGGGSWDNFSNWVAGPPGQGGEANFLHRLSAAHSPAEITLDGSRTVSRLNFDNPNRYVITSPGSLHLTPDGIVDVRQGSHVIAAGFELQGAATFDIAAGASLHVEGTFSSPTDGTLLKTGFGQLEVRHFDGTNLHIAQGIVSKFPTAVPTASALRSLQIDPGATFDILDHGLVISSSPGLLDAVNGWIRQARNGGAWDGAGLTTSIAPFLPITGIGAIANDDGAGAPLYTQLLGQPAALGDILVRFTYNGDTNLNGSVDADDYFRIDSGFAADGALAGWYNGDFDYSGQIDADDYFLIDNAFAGQTGVLGAAAVPEPATFGLLILAAAFATTKRMRRIR